MSLVADWITYAVRGLVGDWFRNVVTFASFVLSWYALRQSRPRLHVSQVTARVVDEDDSHTEWGGRFAVLITVSNDSARPVRIQSVDLHLSNGRILSGKRGPRTPELPCSIPEFGGQETWLVDYALVLQSSRWDGGEDEVSYRAVSRSGRKRYRSREVEYVHPLAPTKQPEYRGRVTQRAQAWIRRWFVPRLQVEMEVLVAGIDLEARTMLVSVRNFGGGFAHGARLELLEECADGSLKRVAEIPPVPVPGLRKNQRRYVKVPIPEHAATWWIRYKGKALNGVSALTRPEARRIAQKDEASSS